MQNRPNLSRVRSAAGRAGGIARWQGVEREPTTLIRVYVSDAERIRAMPGTSAQALRSLLLSTPPLPTTH